MTDYTNTYNIAIAHQTKPMFVPYLIFFSEKWQRLFLVLTKSICRMVNGNLIWCLKPSKSLFVERGSVSSVDNRTVSPRHRHIVLHHHRHHIRACRRESETLYHARLWQHSNCLCHVGLVNTRSCNNSRNEVDKRFTNTTTPIASRKSVMTVTNSYNETTHS